MTIPENLLMTLSEESSEVIQAVAKIMRFGLYSSNGDGSTNNELDLLTEFHQLNAVMEMLYERGIIHELPPDEVTRIREEKKRKVLQYQKLSQERGLLV